MTTLSFFFNCFLYSLIQVKDYFGNTVFSLVNSENSGISIGNLKIKAEETLGIKRNLINFFDKKTGTLLDDSATLVHRDEKYFLNSHSPADKNKVPTFKMSLLTTRPDEEAIELYISYKLS